MRRKSTNNHIDLVSIKLYLENGSYSTDASPTDKRAVRKRAESFTLDNGKLYYVSRPKPVEGEPEDKNPHLNVANLREVIFFCRQQLQMMSDAHVNEKGNISKWRKYYPG